MTTKTIQLCDEIETLLHEINKLSHHDLPIEKEIDLIEQKINQIKQETEK